MSTVRSHRSRDRAHGISLFDRIYDPNSTQDGATNPVPAEDNEPEPGMLPETKELYRVRPRDAWTDVCPDGLDWDARDIAGSFKYAVVARKEQDTSGERGLMLHSILVQSSLIREVLHRVFDSYEGVSTKLKELKFSAPFREFFFRWDRFLDEIAALENEMTIKHMDLLKAVISPEIQPQIDTRDDLVKNGLITHDFLWSIFEPGVEVYSQVDEQDRIFLLEKTGYDPQTGTFLVYTKFVDYNGSIFGYSRGTLGIKFFDGVMPISTLEVLPIHLHPAPDTLKASLSDRGRYFEQMAGKHHEGYNGMYIPKKAGRRCGPLKRMMESGRVIIDSKLFYEYNPDEHSTLDPLSSGLKLQAQTEELRSSRSRRFMACGGGYRGPPPPGESDIRTEVIEPSKPDRKVHLSVQQCYLCTPMVKGFSLGSHEWANFYLEQLQPIKYSELAFSRLVLPFDYKELILAFVTSQLTSNDTFDDIIQGKGQGIIILLHGEPGVGKTLTAEATAEEMHRPLYAMSAGELGYSADQVEANLQRVLDICTKWGAILLIDECDIFLEQRTISDIERNKLVAVFLRLLEYFKGVMFLTTNRVGTFDAAFQSRIHLTINYPSLDRASRKHVWRTFIPPQGETDNGDSRQGHAISEADIDMLADVSLNGREIKNIVKASRLLSRSKRVPLSMDHVNTVLRIKNHRHIVSSS